MVHTEELIYKKAYTELYELVKRLSKEQLSKIPQSFISNLKRNKDNEYVWQYDDSKELEKQYAQERVENNNLPVETRRENFLKKIVDFIRSILKK